jgi:hypothetical protein
LRSFLNEKVAALASHHDEVVLDAAFKKPNLFPSSALYG